jgi:methyltransferase family protein/tetratricopeptide repeat protein
MGNDSQLGQAAFEAGVTAFQAGDHAAAAQHFARALRADPEHARAHQSAGGMAFHAERFSEALEHFERARRIDPRGAQYHFAAGLTHWKMGALEAARECCETTLALAPGFDPALRLLAVLALPGASYFDVLSMIHSHLRPRTYLEIGVEEGQSIALARPETRAIGIDPEPKIARPLGPRTEIRKETSDQYFATHDVRAELDGLPVDLAFIDGMHQFEFALRDFINIEKHSSPQSTVLIHDCYPLTRLSAERERQTTFWSGDIWRLVLLLRKYRPELSVNVIATAPTGLGVVRGLDPASRVLQERLEAIVREFLALDYSVLDADKAGMLALYPNDWDKIKAILQ